MAKNIEILLTYKYSIYYYFIRNCNKFIIRNFGALIRFLLMNKVLITIFINGKLNEKYTFKQIIESKNIQDGN